MSLIRRTVRAVVMLGLSAAGPALGAQTATQTVRFQVLGVSHASVSSMAAPLMVRRTSASMGAASLRLTTNEANQKITASLDRAMPMGMTLSVAVQAPAGAPSRGPSALGADDVDVVTEIPPAAAAVMPLEYVMSGSPAGRLTSESRVVTYTIVTGP